MKVEDFDYDLPDELIAQYPAERREKSRMIVLDRSKEDLRETMFGNFPRYLQEGDLLVINETKVIPARLYGQKMSGGRVEIFLVRRLEDRIWTAMVRPSRRVRPGMFIYVGGEQLPIEILGRLARGEWKVALPKAMSERKFIDQFGHMPLPPYIKRADEEEDRERYQTVFARHEGSVAAPTAGLHFSEHLLERIKMKGVTVLPLSLHVGPGTFKPLDVDEVEKNKLEEEYLMVRRDYWEEIEASKRAGRRIVAVGTTTTRALESLAMGRVAKLEEKLVDGIEYITGWTSLFIYPGFRFRVVDALLTNLHLPRSSLIVLVSAFAGKERILEAYRWAVSRRFRFYSYGDVMFIR